MTLVIRRIALGLFGGKKTPILSKEIFSQLSMPYFLALQHHNLMTKLALFNMPNNGRQEREEKASASMRLGTYASDALVQELESSKKAVKTTAFNIYCDAYQSQ